jgi:hypothetical protein
MTEERWHVRAVALPDGGESFNPLDPQLGYPLELVAAVADAVHEEGGRLAVHVMGRIVREIVEAGADSIEHGN